MNDAPLPDRRVDLRETLLTFPSPAPSVLLRKTADYESGGRRFESFRARHASVEPSTNTKELDYQSLRSLPVVSIGGIRRHEGYERRFEEPARRVLRA